MKQQDTPNEDIAGTYLFEGQTVVVFIEDGKVTARTEDGKQVPPMEVIFSGTKKDDVTS